MKKLLLIFVLGFFIITAGGSPSAVKVRVKDIADIQGIHEAYLIGTGLVVGLNGTGDSKNQLTTQYLTNMVQRLGIMVLPSAVKSKNVAVVLVSAYLPPFAKRGSRIDVQVSSMYDAKSLQGGMLVATPLTDVMDMSKQMHAIAQGQISVGGFSFSTGGESTQKNHPTVGHIPGGAVIHKEMRVELIEDEDLVLVLYRADFTTVSNLVNAINESFDLANSSVSQDIATATDGATVNVKIPAEYKDNLVGFISKVGQITLEVDTPATVVIDERTGTLVIGENVKISPVAVTHGNIQVEVITQTGVSQPSPLSDGETAIIREATLIVNEETGPLRVLPESTNIFDVVDALNALGATPRDLIAILQNIEKQGALHAKLIIR